MFHFCDPLMGRGRVKYSVPDVWLPFCKSVSKYAQVGTKILLFLASMGHSRQGSPTLEFSPELAFKVPRHPARTLAVKFTFILSSFLAKSCFKCTFLIQFGIEIFVSTFPRGPFHYYYHSTFWKWPLLWFRFWGSNKMQWGSTPICLII